MLLLLLLFTTLLLLLVQPIAASLECLLKKKKQQEREAAASHLPAGLSYSKCRLLRRISSSSRECCSLRSRNSNTESFRCFMRVMGVRQREEINLLLLLLPS